MQPEEMKLPELEKSALYTPGYTFRREWVIDPPPLVAERLPDDLLVQIYGIKMAGLAKIAEIEGQIKAIEAEVLSEIAGVLP